MVKQTRRKLEHIRKVRDQTLRLQCSSMDENEVQQVTDYMDKLDESQRKLSDSKADVDDFFSHKCITEIVKTLKDKNRQVNATLEKCMMVCSCHFACFHICKCINPILRYQEEHC